MKVEMMNNKIKLSKGAFKFMLVVLGMFILLDPSLVYANKCMIVVGPMEINLEESGQNTIVA